MADGIRIMDTAKTFIRLKADITQTYLGTRKNADGLPLTLWEHIEAHLDRQNAACLHRLYYELDTMVSGYVIDKDQQLLINQYRHSKPGFAKARAIAALRTIIRCLRASHRNEDDKRIAARQQLLAATGTE